MWIWLSLGLVGLWVSTRWIIRAATVIATHFNLSHTFVGLAVLSVGTDLPEIFVTVDASILHLAGSDTSGIVMGNAIGSSMSQITLVLGIAGVLLNFTMSKNELRRDGIILIVAVLLLALFGWDGLVSRAEGVLLILLYAGYYILLFRDAFNKNGTVADKQSKPYPQIFMLIAGFLLLIISSHMVVRNSMSLAEEWGVSQSFVGILVIGMGTSLPELAVTLGAALKGSPGMTIGNIIGSNIFDGLIPVGLGGLISTASVERTLIYFDLSFLLVSTILVIFFLRSRRGISKAEGFVLIVLYLAYVILKIMFRN